MMRMKCFAICIVLFIFFIAFGAPFTNSTLWNNLTSNCGKTRFNSDNIEDEDRIINGTSAKLGQFPWSVRLGTRYGKRIFFYCGGSLISRTFVVSAAHCEEFGDIARVGQTLETTDKQCDAFGVCAPPYQDITIKKYIFEDFCRLSSRNDIMLIQLETPAQLNDFVQPICLPPPSLQISGLIGKILTVSGWGQQIGNDTNSAPKNLLYTALPVLDPRQCSLSFFQFVKTQQFCLAKFEGKNVCSGDSGGGVVTYMKSGKDVTAYLIGIVSFGREGCWSHSVHTLVQYHLKRQASIGSNIWKNLPKDCGITKYDNNTKLQNMKGRVINGDEAKLGQFPWMARLGIKYKNGNIFWGCGGSLISEYFVISAAHCEIGMNIIRLGQTYETGDQECDGKGNCAPPYQDIKIRRHIMFGEFNPKNYRYDIILYELDRPAELNDYVLPVCLPRTPITHSSLVGENIITAGWGRQNATDPRSTPTNLLYIVVPVLEPKRCSPLFAHFNRTIQFCINRIDDKGVCMGDSGSGAIKYMKIDGETRAYLVGITSHGTEDCTWYSVFTFVQYYLTVACHR